MTSYHRLARIVAVAALPALFLACTGGGGSAALPTIPPPTPTPSGGVESPAPTHPGPTYPPGCPTEQPAPLPAGESRTVTLTTDKGDIAIKVEADLSPIAAGNFVTLAECGYYDGVVFHRIAPGFVIQGGDGQFGRSPDVIPDLVGSGGPRYTIKDEQVTAPYVRGTVAMAKTQEPDSASSQFFIVLSDLGDDLDPRYQVFGHVTGGMDVVDTISNMPNDGSQLSLAVDPVPMTGVTVTNP
jgi:cyclophilin family peptidyl-prolyl cis-trans isomerase